MEPLRIDITLKTAMVMIDRLIHLDALLGALRVNRAYQEHGEGINPRDYHYDIPVERYTTDSGQWVFKASALLASNKQHRESWMQTSRIDLEEAARHRAEGWLKHRASKANTAGGPFKSSLYHLTLGWCDLTAFCVGNKDEIAGLLAECKQIGGRRGVGFGQVDAITVISVPMEQCEWMTRAMPLDTPDLASSHASAISALNAPYWDRRLQVPALLPIGLSVF